MERLLLRVNRLESEIHRLKERKKRGTTETGGGGGGHSDVDGTVGQRFCCCCHRVRIGISTPIGKTQQRIVDLCT